MGQSLAGPQLLSGYGLYILYFPASRRLCFHNNFLCLSVGLRTNCQPDFNETWSRGEVAYGPEPITFWSRSGFPLALAEVCPSSEMYIHLLILCTLMFLDPNTLICIPQRDRFYNWPNTPQNTSLFLFLLGWSRNHLVKRFYLCDSFQADPYARYEQQACTWV